MQQTQNYYEVLQVDPTAEANEIEEAYRREYNKWSRLINHHDPEMQDNARRNLRLIEAAKATLLDEAKRTEHDSALASGLYDESAKPNPTGATGMPVMTPPAPQKSTKKDISTNAWECPKCRTDNSIGTMYCESCGEQLGKDCPNCDYRVRMNAEFCGRCGVNFEQFDIERQQEADQREMERQERLKAIRTQEKLAKEEFFRQLNSMPQHRHRKILEVLGNSQYRTTPEANQVRAMARRQRMQMALIVSIACSISVTSITIMATPRFPLTQIIPLAILFGICGAISGYLWCGKRGGQLGIAVDTVLGSIYGFLVLGVFYFSWIAILLSLEDQKPYKDV